MSALQPSPASCRVIPKFPRRLATALALALGVLACAQPAPLQAQTSIWDSILTDSQWYVPAANLSAYLAPGTNLAAPELIADQTIWTLGDSVNGVFTGTSVATFKIGPVTQTSTTSMQGLVVTESGQLRIVFSQEGAPPTIGIGQMREVEGATYVEMQMISGSTDSVFITHWAYMAAYDADSTVLPPLVPESELLSPEWSWMRGTEWTLECADLFGLDEAGAFHIDDYSNGYFWGTGSGPAGSEAESFTLLGSATPEGNILFNILSGDTLTSLTGQITGTATDGGMALRAYESGDVGSLAVAQVVPEPGAIWLLALGGLFLVRRALWRTCIRPMH